LLVGIILVLAAIVFVVHALGLLSRLTFGSLLVDPIGTGGLGEAVNFGTGETSDQLLCELVADWFAC